MIAVFSEPLHRFRILALIEGISFLLIFGVSLPLKYMLGYTTIPYIIGMSHGVLFVLYVIMAIELIIRRRVTFFQFLRIIFASIIPFGTFFNDKMLKEQQLKFSKA